MGRPAHLLSDVVHQETQDPFIFFSSLVNATGRQLFGQTEIGLQLQQLHAESP